MASEFMNSTTTLCCLINQELGWKVAPDYHNLKSQRKEKLVKRGLAHKGFQTVELAFQAEETACRGEAEVRQTDGQGADSQGSWSHQGGADPSRTTLEIRACYVE